MTIDFSKHKNGDTVHAFCCDECARSNGVAPKRPPDSGNSSWLCDVCGHYNIGSMVPCKISDWLTLKPNAGNERAPD